MVAVLAPFAAVGAGLNVVPFTAMTLVSARTMPRISRANATLLTALVSFPLAWTGRALLGRHRLRHPWRAAFLAGPLCGHAAVVVGEHVDHIRRAKLQWRRLRAGHGLVEGLRDTRATVIAAVDTGLSRGPAPASLGAPGPWPPPVPSPPAAP
jgi:hypothetical protein